MKTGAHRILIVDDEPDIREVLALTLGRMNLETRSAANLDEARSLLGAQRFDLCLTDMRLPDGNGIELVQHIHQRFPEVPVAVITAFGSMETAVSALKAGAFDFLTKPIDLNDLRNIVRGALSLGEGTRDTADGGDILDRLLGTSRAIAEVCATIHRLARSQAPVYVSGESGTGKELAARLIHELGSRAHKPFIAVNCGAIPEALMESEFFGHRKGSFTGAVQDKEGLFRAAHGGTLFLDEVGDLPLAMQVKLLRAIQERSVRAVGNEHEERVDVRIICATHRDLHAAVAEGMFRQDLYYRLNVIELTMPPLRSRPEDIPVLSRAILERLSRLAGCAIPMLSEGAVQTLKTYAFPGNVRELENILERSLALHEGNTISAGDLRLPAAGDLPSTPEAAADVVFGGRESLDAYLDQIERRLVLEALNRSGQNKTQAAKLLGISFRSFRYKLEKLGIR